MARGLIPVSGVVIEKAIALLNPWRFVEYTTLPHTEYALSTYYLIAPARPVQTWPVTTEALRLRP